MDSTKTAAKASQSVIGSVRKFAAAHGGATAVLQPVGESGVRVTLVGADGVLGDRMTPNLAAAREIVAAVENLSESDEWTRELTSEVTPRAGHWAKMAGWVARQTRFPKPRNAATAA